MNIATIIESHPTVATFPTQIKVALEELDLTNAQPVWPDLLAENAGNDDERWTVIALTLFALRTYQRFPEISIHRHLAEYGLLPSHRLTGLVKVTLSIFDEMLFPQSPLIDV